MGHYCYSCSEELVGGILSTKCDCIECFCKKCWDDLFKDTYNNISQVLYYKSNDSGTFKRLDKTLYEKVPVKQVWCPVCGVEWDKESDPWEARKHRKPGYY